MHQQSYNKTWLGLAVILSVIFFSGWFIFDKYFQNELEVSSRKSKEELVFIADLVKERLQKHDYQLAERFIADWGKRTPDIFDITLTTENGFELAYFSSSEIPVHKHVEEIKLSYSYDGTAILKLHKSLDDIYARHQYFLYELLVGYIFITVIFFYLTYTIVRTQKQKQELSFENKRRVRSEKRLLESQQIAQLGSWELDLMNDKLEWSDEVYRIFEINPEIFAASYESFIDTIHPDDRGFVDKTYADSVSNREPYNIDHRLLMKDGRIKYVNERCETIYDNSGKPLRSIGTILDITERKQADDLARQGKLVLDSVFQALPDLFFLMDADGTIRDYRAQRSSDLYVTEEAFLGKRMQDVLPPPLAAQFAENIGKVNAIGEMVVYEYAMELPHGLRQFESRLSQLHDSTQIISVVRDITERKQAEEQIRTLSQAIEQSPISVMITDADANIEYVNSTFEQVTGYSSEEVIGKNPRILQSGKTPIQTYQEMWQTISSGNAWTGELQNRRKNGDIFWEQANIAPVLDESGTISHYLAVREDISLRKKQEEKILHQAHFDALTELPNRFLSLDRLSQLISDAQRNHELVAVVFLDLDDFKKINDTLGHDLGDKLLIKAAKRLNSEVRSGDTVGRLGGDEFIILLGGLEEPADAQPVVENLLNRFRDAFRIDGRELVLTASAGVAVYPNDGDNPSVLLRNADSAMYHAKEEGRNTYSYFTSAMNQGVSRRLALEEQMHGALDRGEFRLNYQPKIEIVSRRIIGVEALLRWNNPALGEVMPEEFIPIAEQTGLIISIGQFVLTKALEVTANWQQEHEPQFSIAINLSPRQFRDPNLIAFIEKAIVQSGVSGESLELEITEGVLLSGHAHIDNALAALNDLDVSIAMDDFGTGYSSLSYLRSYPFDVLKIDRSFINDITVDTADRELVNAAIAMAHSLGLKVVAEGVETEEQLALLAVQGCEIAQGYLFSKPVSAEEITGMLVSATVVDHPGKAARRG
ncbi:MAG: EAL domain-containing protein [Gammaproteobacteria bacterium]|nr:EAL domain-containing protein [Gammaproteobacteria bacterium]